MKNNIVLKRNYILDDDDISQILKYLNESRILNRQKYSKKNTVSFYDDDDICYFMLSMPEYDELDNDLFDVLDFLGCYCGVTACKVNGEWL